MAKNFERTIRKKELSPLNSSQIFTHFAQPLAKNREHIKLLSQNGQVTMLTHTSCNRKRGNKPFITQIAEHPLCERYIKKNLRTVCEAGNNGLFPSHFNWRQVIVNIMTALENESEGLIKLKLN